MNNNNNKRPLVNFIPYLFVSLFLLMMAFSSPGRTSTTNLNYREFNELGRRAKKLVIGAESAAKSAKEGTSFLIIYASDFSANSLKPVMQAANEYGVSVIKLNRTKQELSFALGKLCGVASVDDKGFADKLRQMIEAE